MNRTRAHSIGRVSAVSYNWMSFEVSDFSSLQYNFNGQLHTVNGVIDYVVVPSKFNETFLYQIIKIEDKKERPLTSDETAKFEHVGLFHCVPIGILKDNHAEFNFTRYPSLQDEVYLADNMDLDLVFPIKSYSESIHLGTMNKENSVYVNMNSLLTHHTAILGNTGSGKSTTIRRILVQSLNKNSSNLKILLFDTHGEYTFIQPARQINVSQERGIKLSDLNFQDWINLVKPSDLVQLPILEMALRISNAISSDTLNKDAFNCYIALTLYMSQQTDAAAKRVKICSLLNNVEGSSDHLKNYDSKFGNFSSNDEKNFQKWLNSKIGDFNISVLQNSSISENCAVNSFADLLTGLEYAFLLEESKGNSQARAFSKTLETRIRYISNRYSALFKESLPKHTRAEIPNNTNAAHPDFNPKILSQYTEKIIIFNLQDLDDDLLLFFTSFILKHYLEYKRSTQDKSVTIFLLEEAHRYICVSNKDTQLHELEVFKTAAREGRKFGCFLLISSQRPSELSGTVLSQCDNYIIHRIKNNFDLDYLAKTIPYVTKDQLVRVSFLPTGTAFIVGELFPVPVEVSIAYESDIDNSQTPQIIFNPYNDRPF